MVVVLVLLSVKDQLQAIFELIKLTKGNLSNHQETDRIVMFHVSSYLLNTPAKSI